MRLDHYIKIGDNDIHLAQIIYSISTIGVLVLILSIVIQRSIKKDFANLELVTLRRKAKREERRRGTVAASEDEMGFVSGRKAHETEDVSWKKIQGDVFRAPAFPAILSTLCGIGA